MTILGRRSFLLAAGGLALGRAAQAATNYTESVAIGVSTSQRKIVRKLVDAYFLNYGAPGLSVAFAKDGAHKYVAAFGTPNAAVGDVLDPTHSFRIASISKPITASAIMELVQGGRLQLEQRVFGPDGILGARFPLPASAVNKEWLLAITVHHLLSHTCGGWSNDGNDPMFRNIKLGHDELVLKTLARNPLAAQPGTAYAYSNFGYCLLGRIIETLTGESYEGYVRRRILDPAGAAMSIASNTRAGRKKNEVVYAGQDGENPYAMNVTRMDSHGGWIGTAASLVNFGLHVDGYATVPDIISPKSVARMRTPTKVYPGYGRGWTLNPLHNNRWHTGSLPGSTTILVLVDGGNCFAGLVNTRRSSPNSGDGLDKLMWDIYAQVMN